MRRVIKFSCNYNGKLCLDVFTTIRLYDYDQYPDSELYEIEYKNKTIGVAELVGKKAFKFKDLNEMTAYVDSGHGKHYLQKLLKSFYGEKLVEETPLYMLLFQWKVRDREAFSEIFNERWERLVNADEGTDRQPAQLTLKM